MFYHRCREQGGRSAPYANLCRVTSFSQLVSMSVKSLFSPCIFAGLCCGYRFSHRQRTSSPSASTLELVLEHSSHLEAMSTRNRGHEGQRLTCTVGDEQRMKSSADRQRDIIETFLRFNDRLLNCDVQVQIHVSCVCTSFELRLARLPMCVATVERWDDSRVPRVRDVTRFTLHPKYGNQSSFKPQSRNDVPDHIYSATMCAC